MIVNILIVHFKAWSFAPIRVKKYWKLSEKSRKRVWKSENMKETENMEANPRSEIHKSAKWTWRSPLNNFYSKSWKIIVYEKKKKFSIWETKIIDFRFSDCFQFCSRFSFKISDILRFSDVFSKNFEIFQIFGFSDSCSKKFEIFRFSQKNWDFDISDLFGIFQFCFKISRFLIFQKFQMVQQNKFKNTGNM